MVISLLDVLVGTMNSKVSNLGNTPCQLVARSGGTKGIFLQLLPLSKSHEESNEFFNGLFLHPLLVDVLFPCCWVDVLSLWLFPIKFYCQSIYISNQILSCVNFLI